jgi:trimeric autotransporter adhesin
MDRSHGGCGWCGRSSPRFIWRLSVATRWMLNNFLLVLSLSCVGLSVASAGTQYLYDNLGHLVKAVNLDGSTIAYQYDASGNVASINRDNSNVLAIVGVSSSNVYVGASLTILGTGFNADSSQDTVTISGVTCAVTSAASGSLVVIVPTNAVTGSLVVTVGGMIANGSLTITILRPMISSFTPTVVNPGASVSLTGTNMNLVPGSTSVAIAGVVATFSSVSNTSITFAAPTVFGMTPITLNTPYGIATSSSALTVVPSSIGAASVSSYGSIAAGSSVQSISISSPSNLGVLEFTATAGQWSTFQVSSLSTVPSGGSVGYTIYTPSGVVFLSGVISAANTNIHLPVITAGGKYFIAFASGTNSSVQLQTQLLVNATPVLIADGSPLPRSTSTAGQQLQTSFSATAGQNLGLALSNLTTTGAYATMTVYKPDGTSLSSQSCTPANGGCVFTLRNLAVTGTYSVVVVPYNASTSMSFNLTLSQPVTGVLTAGGAAQSVNLVPGQYTLLNFTVTAGQTVSVPIASLATTPAGKSMNAYVYNAVGTQVTSANFAAANYTLNLSNLAAGTYTILIVPQYANITLATMQVSVLPAVSGVLQANGTSTNVSTVVPGQNVYYTFSATAGQNLGLALSNLATTGASVTMAVYKPDGTSLSSQSCTPANGGCVFTLRNLAATGTYSIVVTPYNASTSMSFNLTLSQPVTGTLTVGGTAQSVSLVPGQFTMLTFTATAGQTVAIPIASLVTTPAGKSMSAYVYNSTGTQLTSGNFTAANYTLNLSNLAVGTYTILIVPQYANITAATMQVSVLPGLTGVLQADGSSTSVSTVIAGQNAYYTFTATAGQNLGLGLSNLTTAGSYATMTVYKPSGVSLSTVTCPPAGGGCVMQMRNLAAGTYSVVVTPYDASTSMSFNFALSQPVTGTLTIGGAAQSVSLPVTGQYALLTFTITAGQAPTLAINALSTTPSGKTMDLNTYDASGSREMGASFSASRAFSLAGFPVGTHTLVIAPRPDARSTTMQVSLQ